ncbi:MULTISPECIES: hypothetical protein [unclassified Caballeronia]|uniref:hypothetical protein n=1 Tax=unclassified Caballeronia TaxID=2646786 RepID=UPI002028C80E|nr:MULTISPECIES: hypothetical protein [unclassified Caballeronia]
MKNKRSVEFALRTLSIAVVAGLAACGHSTPSESDAKRVVAGALKDCKYLQLTDFKKINGIPGDQEGTYRVDVRYTIRMSPDSEVKDRVTQWRALYDRYRSMKTDAEQKSMDFYKRKRAYVDANPTDFDARSTFEQQHQDEYKPILAEGVEVGNLAQQVNFLSPATFFQSRVRQACPNVSYTIIANFFEGKWADLGNDIDVQFTATLAMIETENGWQAAR